jgi:DHA2 family multidrug resistance protein
VVWPQLIQGVAIAGFFVPLSAIILSGLPPARIAAASGLANFARITAGAFGASIAVTLWEDRAALHHAQLAESVTPYRPAAQMAQDALQQQGASEQQALFIMNRSIDTQAATLSAVEFFWASGLVFLALIALVALARNVKANKSGPIP